MCKTTFKYFYKNAALSMYQASYYSWRPLRLLLAAIGYADSGIQLIAEYFKFADQLVSNHGLVQTVKILKDLDSRTKLVVIKQRVARDKFGGKWFKTHPSGLPSCLPKLIIATEKHPTAATCVTALVRLIRLPPSYDVSTITSPNTMPWPPAWLTDYSTFVEKSLKPIQIEVKNPWHTSTKAGPNGPAAVVSAGLDAIYHGLSPGHQSLFEQGCQATGLTWLWDRHLTFVNDYLKLDKVQLNHPKQPTLAKLAYLSDKAGKTRVVYILNYWWQELLKPLHDAVFNWLRRQEQDGTFDQRKAVETVLSWTKQGKPLWSYDLTAATDRWPKLHQVIGLHQIAGPIWSKVWIDSTNITPYSYPHKGWISYGVGQPMGAYASWANLALTHHLLIRWCACRAGVSWNCYVVLGDDVVISDHKVAKLYMQALTDLGVTISQAKSVIWENQISGSSAEFAKQILFDGQDFSPFSPNLLKEIYDDHQWWKLLDLLQQLKDRGSEVAYKLPDGNIWLPTPISELLGPISRYKDKLIALIGDPESPRCLITEVKEGLSLPDGKSYINPWAGVDNLTYLTLKGEMVTDKLVEMINQLNKLKDKLGGEDAGSKAPGWALELPSHPIWAIIDRLNEAIMAHYRYIATGDHPHFGDVVQLAMDAEFLECLLTKGTSYREWKDQKSRRLKIACNFSMELLRKIRELDSPTTVEKWEDW